MRQTLSQRSRKKWRTIESRVAYQGTKLTVVENQVRLPDGTQTTYSMLSYQFQCATIIAQRDDGKFLLLSDYLYPTDKVLFQFPGGIISPNETLENGANRELREESGYRAETLSQLGKYYINPSKSNLEMVVFSATHLVRDPLASDPEEDFDLHWVTQNEMNELIKSNEIDNAQVLSPWMFYLTSLSQN